MNRLLKVGFSHGSGDKDSYELIVRLLGVPELLELCTPVVFGTVDAANRTMRDMTAGRESGLEPIKWNLINKPGDAAEGKANVYERFEGSADEAANNAAQEGAFKVLITPSTFTPSAPEALTATRVAQRSYFCPELTDETTASLLDALRKVHQCIRADFKHLRPRIAIILPSQSTLETTVLHDVCRTLREEGILAFGPFSEEVFEAQQMADHYDAIVVAGDADTLRRMTAEAAADVTFGYTTGLNYVHAYPIHQDDPSDLLASLHQALYSAIDICRNRVTYAHATHAPLEKQWNPRGKDDFKLDLTKDVDAD